MVERKEVPTLYLLFQTKYLILLDCSIASATFRKSGNDKKDIKAIGRKLSTNIMKKRLRLSNKSKNKVETEEYRRKDINLRVFNAIQGYSIHWMCFKIRPLSYWPIKFLWNYTSFRTFQSIKTWWIVKRLSTSISDWFQNFSKSQFWTTSFSYIR